jgi:hypothetical protein
MARMVALVRALIEYGPTSRSEIYLNPRNIVPVVPAARQDAGLQLGDPHRTDFWAAGVGAGLG